MIRPKKMVKVSVLGPKSRMDTVIERLHDLGLLHIDEYREEYEEAGLGEPSEEAEELSDRLVKLQSVKSSLPEIESREEAGEEPDIEQLEDRVEDLREELDQVQERIEDKRELLGRIEIVEELGLELDDLRDYRSLEVHLGRVDDFSFEEELEEGRYDLYSSGDLVALFADRDMEVEDALRSSGFERIDLEDLKERSGSAEEGKMEVRKSIQNLEDREEELREELRDIGSRWRKELEEEEEELEKELEKAEAPLNFATTDSSFIAEGWVPAERYEEMVEELENATQGDIYIEKEEEEEEAPVEHDNPGVVQPAESLLGMYGIPSYSEVDPTFLLMTFPVLFGFMLGDIGYGITTFAVFYAFYRKFPEARGIWVSLMYASVATIAFGFVYGEMFGFIIFGHGSALAELTGIHLFSEIPLLFHRTHHLGLMLKLSVLIGALHVNFGLLIGAYNEYVSHGIREAVFAKLSWFIIEAGALLAVLTGMTYTGVGVMAAGTVMLYRGENIEGVVEIPSLLSNILSYLRVFGVIMAVIALAAVVNKMAAPLFQSGNPAMIGLGVLVLVVGHTFNTFLKLMEAGLQGIRLHYVEFFTKFFEGGGEYYRPFGGGAE
ncbi:MAG: V-type ATP synthase subunit I [Candidatus Nanohaloarchaea archaeon]